MRTLLIGHTKCHASKRLQEEFQKKGLLFEMVTPRNLVFSVKDQQVAFKDKEDKNLLEYDVYIFRGMGKMAQELSVIAGHLKKHGKVIVEDVLADRSAYFDKFTPSMTDNGVLVIDYDLIFSKNEKMNIAYPVIAKNLESSMGIKVRLLENASELSTFAKKFGYPILLQKYYPITHDFRVMVVGHKALGAMKRYNTGDDFLTIRSGGVREKVDLPQEALFVAEKSAEVAGLSVAGVDLLEYEGKYYRIEVNMSPQFKVFEKTTGINVALAICEMLEMKYHEHLLEF